MSPCHRVAGSDEPFIMADLREDAELAGAMKKAQVPLDSGTWAEPGRRGGTGHLLTVEMPAASAAGPTAGITPSEARGTRDLPGGLAAGFRWRPRTFEPILNSHEL